VQLQILQERDATLNHEMHVYWVPSAQRSSRRRWSDFQCAAVRLAMVWRAKRIRFRDKKTAPHTDRCGGGRSPPERSWKSSTVL